MKNNEEDVALSMQKKIQKIKIITMPGSVALGLGAYAKFVANGDAFHPLLNNQSFALGLIIFGLISTFWGAYEVKKITSVRQQDAENI